MELNQKRKKKIGASKEKEKEVEMGEDRISALPDCLIHHILSFLDMLYVVQTSVLATRWRYLWTSVPALSFDIDLFDDTEEKVQSERFVRFMNHVLLLHENYDIQRFVLNSFQYRSLEPKCLRSWIANVVRHNVQELDLDTAVEEMLPDSVFVSKSLVKLRLRLSADDFEELCLPDSISLPSLKSMHIEGWSLENDTSASRLFSSCPSLECLTIHYSQLDHLEELSIAAPRLQHLKITDCFGWATEDYFYEDYYQNGVPSIKIKISAPSLKSFICHEAIYKEYYLCGCSSLEKADVSFKTDYFDLNHKKKPRQTAEKKKVYGQRLRRLFERVSMVNDLTLSAVLLEFVSKPPSVLENLPMKFCNLRHLKLGAYLSTDCINGIMYLIKISPSLETLIVEKERCWNIPRDPYFDEDEDEDEDEADLGNVLALENFLLSSQCMSHHLKFVELHNIEGRANELKFLEFLLGSSLVMDKISVFTSEEKSFGTKSRFINFSNKVLALKRASPSLAILFFLL